MSDYSRERINLPQITTLIKTLVVGILSAETLYLANIVAHKLNEYILRNNYETGALITCSICLIILLSYLSYRRTPSFIESVRKSGRIDILIIYIIGALISLAFDGIGYNLYEHIVSTLSINQLLILLSLPIMIGFVLILRILSNQPRKPDSPFFISDLEQKSKKDDLLNFSDRANNFAERVLNQGSSESLVFGIDAPWGIGKSTFVNFCKEIWNDKYSREVIVYSFNPLRYEDRANLLEKFIDGLVRTIQKNTFVPEIRPIISKYSRFIKSAKGTVPFFGMNLEIVPGDYTIDDAFDDLETVLADFDKKIIIVVDDLDRLSLSAIMDILFVIKKSFTLPNITYVLCYDTENISILEKNGKPDTEKIMEFLEKFVNVKISIYLDSATLTNYIESNLAKALAGNSQADPILVSKAVRGLIDIYKSKDYHRYLLFIGDVRKLKRLLNTLLLFEIEKTDFDNTDFNNQDLIHLLLIYINYPNIFRKIYNTETDGKRGFFSVVVPFDEGYPENKQKSPHSREENKYQNSDYYTEYLEKLSDNQKFLLNKVFDASYRLENKAIDNVPEENRRSFACFNGAWTNGRNLEEYLNLIVKLSKPQPEGQYRYYLNCKNEIVNGKSVEEVLTKEAFSYTKPESNHEQFWRVITNSALDYSRETAAKLITYLMNNIHNYSFFTNEKIGVGLRDDINFFIIKLLNVAGWNDKKGKHQHNSEENIAEVAEWIFGEGQHTGTGLIEILGDKNRGLLGLYDLLAFRLFCSADRGGDIFNLQRALSKHGDPKAPIEGSTRDIAVEEMREISQKIFQLFKTQYIDKSLNIFEMADSLTLHDLAGKYLGYIQENQSEIENFEKDIGHSKSRIKSFVTYQLGNSLISSGVGIGYYDPEGKEDRHEINTLINNYLFEECFNPAKNEKNYEHFLDYLLINFASAFPSESDGRGYIPHINEFTKVLNRGQLANYWQTNKEAINALDFTNKNKAVYAGGYTASYKDDLPQVYKILDDLLKDSGKQEPMVESQPVVEPQTL